ncbi:hypothetical protein QYF61_000173 [Mycteria americana]|uniref:Uncharacterized protein n=1 Tax=Mycteria americana TaxID=33587 RepID=A0AAN7S0P3_MYCAM|nr:hypothetical protein QYF61_000173 [Mycteria americana]
MTEHLPANGKEAALNPFITQPVLILEFALTQVQDLVLGFVGLHEVTFRMGKQATVRHCHLRHSLQKNQDGCPNGQLPRRPGQITEQLQVCYRLGTDLTSSSINQAEVQPPLLRKKKFCRTGQLGWRLNHFPGQPVPMLDNPFSEVKFPNIQSKPPLVQLETISSCPITCYLGEETDTHLATTSFQVVVESDKVSPQPPFLQAKQPQLPQPLLIRLLLQTLHQLRCPSLDTLQPLNVSLVVRGPKLNTVFEVRPHQCRVQGHDRFPSPAGHAISDTSQDAIGFLGHLGTLLAHIQPAVNQHPQVLLCQAAFQPLFPKPVALHGVVVTQVQDLALGLVEPHTIGPSPSIQPGQVPLQSLPTLKHIDTPAQLGVICKLTEGALDPFVQIIDKDIKQNWPQHRALGNTACDRPPTGVNSIHHHSLGPAIQPVLYPAKSTPVQAMSSQFLQENAVGNRLCCVHVEKRRKIKEVFQKRSRLSCITGEVFHPSDKFCGPPDLFQQVHVFPVVRTPELDAVRQGHLPLDQVDQSPNLDLNTSRDGASTTSLGNLFRCLITLTDFNPWYSTKQIPEEAKVCSPEVQGRELAIMVTRKRKRGENLAISSLRLGMCKYSKFALSKMYSPTSEYGGWVSGGSMIIPLATNACAQRAANIKETTSQLTEWKVSLAVPVLRSCRSNNIRTMEMPENGHVGIRASPPKKLVGSITQLKCICTNAHSMGNKQEELEAIVQQENYDIVAITETWWDDSHNWSAAMDGYKLFRRDGQGRGGGWVALYVRECFDCLELNDCDDRVECLWLRIRVNANKADFMSPLGGSPGRQRSPGRLGILQEGKLKGAGADFHHVPKDELQGRRLAWLNRELWLELRKKKRVYNLWKKGQATLEGYKDVMRLCMEKIRRAKAQLELNLATAIENNKKCFYKYISNKKRAKENLHPLLDVGGNIVTKAEEKDEVLNAFFALSFNSKTSCSLVTQPPELEDRDKERNEALVIPGKWLVTCYTT